MLNDKGPVFIYGLRSGGGGGGEEGRGGGGGGGGEGRQEHMAFRGS